MMLDAKEAETITTTINRKKREKKRLNTISVGRREICKCDELFAWPNSLPRQRKPPFEFANPVVVQAVETRVASAYWRPITYRQNSDAENASH